MTAIAIAAAVIATVAAFVTLIVMLREAERRTADARVNDATKAWRIAILEAEVKTQTARGDSEQRRADALDKELDAVAADGDVAGARERVLARWRRQAGSDPVPAAGDGTSAVHDEPAANPVAVVDHDGLDRPGD